MKLSGHVFLALLFTFTAVAFAKDSQGTFHYLDPAGIDLKVLLPDPPADGSPETKKEIEVILAKQEARTPAEVTRAQSEVELTPESFKEVFGPWFDAQKLPVTWVLLENVKEDVHAIAKQGKKYWNRLRPPQQDPGVKPVVEIPKNASYPSGHATMGTALAIVLVELAPDLKEKILARGFQIGDDRVIAGAHFPSDVDGGRTLGKDLAAQLLANAAFQADLAKAKAEVSQARTN